MSKARPGVDLIVLNYNGKKLLAAALPSMYAQAYEPFTLTVVDNGSTDGSVELVEEQWPGTRVVSLPENVGVTAALNRGIEAGDAPYLALLNNDLELDPGWLRELVAELERHPEAGSATGKLLSYRRRNVIDGAGDVVSWSGACVRRGRGEVDRGQYDVPGAVFSASGAAALYRRSAFDVVGPFDEDFFAYLEDVDWGFRAQLAGYSCRYVPTAVAYHMGGATTGSDERLYLAHLRRNTITLVVKNYPATRLVRHAHRLLAYQAAHFLVSVRDRKARDHLRSIGEALAALPATLRKRRRIQATRRVDPAYLESVLARDWGFEVSKAGGRRFAQAVWGGASQLLRRATRSP
jgi:GT2 family glycosyltransferase